MSPCEEAESDIWNLRPRIEGFLPRSLVKQKFLNPREKIVTILGCPCAECKKYRNLVKDGRDQLILETFVDQILDDAVSLFALLASLRKAVLVVPFLRQGKFDSFVLDSLAQKPTKIAKRVFKDLLEKNSESRNLAGTIELLDNQIEGNWTTFLRPAIVGSKVPYRKFDDRYVLPIYDDKPIDQGVSSRVYRFKIYEGYNEINDLRMTDILVRKELAMKDHVEMNTLWELNRIGHRSIVRLLACYEHKGSINLVFPLSKTNLRHFLRDPVLQLGQSNFANIFRAPIWDQIVEIVDALRSIHTSPGKIRIHFDLKPENVLVGIDDRHNFHFMITDFGLAVTKDPSKEGSKERYGGGDAGYGPPDDETDFDRAYDIWSMGCIILEILSFTVWGYQGPERLDKARGSQYLAFWHRKTDRISLKPGVQSIIDGLKKIGDGSGDAPKSLSPRNMAFVRSMALLVEKMLRISQIERLTSEQVLREIKDIRSGKMRTETETSLERHTDSDESDDPETPSVNSFQLRVQRTGLALPAKDEKELGAQVLSGLRTIVARSAEDLSQEDEPITLQIFQWTFQNIPKLRFVMTPLNEEKPIVYKASRQSLELVPAYAFRETHDVPRRLAGLRLIQDGDSRMGMSHTLDGDLIELRVIHGILMNQEIVHSATLTRLTILKHHKRLFGRGQDETVLDEEGPITVQLWRNDAKSGYDCRIVFYVKNQKIIIMKFNESLGLTKEEDNEYRQTPILPSFLNKGADSARFSSFGSLKDEQPSLPIDEVLFHKECLRNEHQLTNLYLCFNDFEARKFFVETYRSMKRVWMSRMAPP